VEMRWLRNRSVRKNERRRLPANCAQLQQLLIWQFRSSCNLEKSRLNLTAMVKVFGARKRRTRTMRQVQKVSRAKVGVLELAKQLGTVSQCMPGDGL
jgi:hypothetical protein